MLIGSEDDPSVRGTEPRSQNDPMVSRPTGGRSTWSGISRLDSPHFKSQPGCGAEGVSAQSRSRFCVVSSADFARHCIHSDKHHSPSTGFTEDTSLWPVHNRSILSDKFLYRRVKNRSGLTNQSQQSNPRLCIGFHMHLSLLGVGRKP